MIYNDAYRPILGEIKHPGAMGQRGEECWLEIWDIIGPMLEGVLSTGRATWSDDQLLLLNRNGYVEECYFTFSYSPIFAEAGKVGGVFTAVTETTERVLGERRLKTLGELSANTAQTKTVADACHTSIQTLLGNPADVPFALLYLVNEPGTHLQLQGIIGLPSDTCLSPAVIDLATVSEFSSDLYLSSFEGVLRSGEAIQIDGLVALVEEDLGHSNPFPNCALVLPITQSGQSHPIGLLIGGVNPRRELDEEYRGFFKLVVGQIETAIGNAHTYEAERQRAEALAELDRAKTVFFSNISHEFRTPLTLMLSPLEDILQDKQALPPSQQQQLELIQRNGLRLQKLVNTLLDFSRIEAGRIQASYQPTDLATFTTDLASTFRSALERAGLQFYVNCPPLPEDIYVDREMWEKIVLNLLSNAFKFTFTGEIGVSLRWSGVEGVGDAGGDREDGEAKVTSSGFPLSAILEIHDTGIGIPPSEIPHLFERFHRVKGAEGRTFEGSGIGLSLVQEMVQLHGGTIAVTSAVGAGSCFTVSIPAGCAHLPPEAISLPDRSLAPTPGATAYVSEALRWLPPQEEREAEAGEEIGEDALVPLSLLSPPTPYRILVVDDNTDMRDYLSRLLSRHHYQVEAVANGDAALESIRANPPDLVLSDVMMPGMDGYGLLHTLRSDAATRQIPFILLSARAGEESQVEGRAAGADDYLVKPFSVRELLVRVQATLKMAQVRQEALRQEQELRLASQSAQQQAELAYTRFYQILERMTDAFVELDNEWRIVYLNAEAERLNQKPRSAMIGKTHWEEWPASVGTNIEFQYRWAMAEQTAVHFEHRYYSPSEYELWLEIHAYPSPEGLGIFYRDVTARRLVERNLQASEERFRLAAQAIDGVVYDWNVQTGEVYRSEGLYHLIGTRPEEAAPTREWWTERIHPDDLKFLTSTIFALQTSEAKSYDFEYRVRHADGHWVDVWDRGYLVRNDQGLVARVVGSSSDITARKRLERALRVSETKFKRLVDSNIVGMIVADTEFILEANDVFFEMVGYSREDLATGNLRWTDLTPPEYAPLDEQGLLQLQTTGKCTPFEKEYIRKDGSRLPILIGATTLEEPPTTWLCLILDLSDRKRAEAERENLLLRERLAREEAENANRIKDEFLTVLSHELRSPLNPILGWTKLLQSRKFGEAETRRALETIERNARLQTQLIEDLLDVSRILRGKMVLNVYPVNLLTITQAAIETVHLAAEAKQISIRLEDLQDSPPPSSIIVSGDAARLQQVVWNLLSNSVKFTPEGGRVTVRLQRVVAGNGGDGGDRGAAYNSSLSSLSSPSSSPPPDSPSPLFYAQITVTDTGKGIKPEFLPYVFDYFRQEDGRTTRQFGGLGLGLAIVRYLTELHGGSVSAQSVGEGRGATFTVLLPLFQQEKAVAQNNQALFSILPHPTCLAAVRILVVDDEADMRELILTLLQQYGAEVATAASAEEALSKLGTFQPNLLISDIGMPRVDGYMLMQQVRKLSPQTGGTVPAIALTAYAGEYNQRQALAAGFQLHLGKPVEPNELIEAIIQLLQ
jgi:PAS domain S-box-containing protein